MLTFKSDQSYDAELDVPPVANSTTGGGLGGCVVGGHGHEFVLAAAGATTAELMRRMGHSTPNMAVRYQHALDDRDSEIARKLSQMVAR